MDKNRHGTTPILHMYMHSIYGSVIAHISRNHTTGGDVHLRAGVIFSIENVKFWPILAHFDQFWLLRQEFTYFLVYFLLA